MRGDLPWRATGAVLFAAACGVSQLPSSASASGAIGTGLSLLSFCLAMAGVMLLVSGRHWLDRMGSTGAMPVVRTRARRRINAASSLSSASRARRS
ncbi:hypothetical protein M0208_12185 [Sphingomonas sp. SUN019]|uniref:hypothetical protein n=1 Tax=Sphingomonas sp. SUN019 TaxID=2937788 RepID=UPI0021648C8C|nr:hypothetical protein [Sphingomonas sp. SUN019]UVO51227.1 hypothetical protein M0208_12185 [Sphingomonas sp. SUN019]